ncbi:hypothetical protein [Sphingomonas bacterium]|uniref:hypothetical protein n=1 Tax=Sphingomonas bacterium TaxID=1895847 RepID=UPI0015753EF8|nr:hypothetical protein [Sphingomonas bacterium]
MTTNDNDPTTRNSLQPSGDPHGLAALLLVESLIHGLCETSTLSTGEAVDIVERAVSVQFDQAEEANGDATSLWRSHGLLSSIAASLATDGGGSPTPPSLVR